MAKAAGAAAAASAYFNSKPAPDAGPTGFRLWKTEVSVWQRLTTMSPATQAPTMVAALTGVAKRLALTMPEDELFSPDGVAKLVALMEGRFGGATGTTRVAAFNGLRACGRGASSMEEYLVSFDEALVLCVEAGCSVDDLTQANVVLHQAGLTDTEQMLVVAMASKGTEEAFTYADVTRALLTLFGGKGKGKATALVTAPTGGRLPQATRRPGAPGRGTATPGAGSTCWYCNKTGHLMADCKLKERHLRERGSTPGAGGSQDAAGPVNETIHLLVLAGTTGHAWGGAVGEAILDPGATATVVGAAWAEAFLSALPSHLCVKVTRSPAAVQLKFGAGDPVSAGEQIILPCASTPFPSWFGPTWCRALYRCSYAAPRSRPWVPA